MGRIQLTHTYKNIISVENLLLAWEGFMVGKRGRKDVQVFEMNLMKHIFVLHYKLERKTYRHSEYEAFNISDTKPRSIHKATVRDRLLHHAIYQKLYPFFDRTFIADSYSCRIGKGTHKAINRFRAFSYKVSNNHTKTTWVLKCDIRKFFASIDHATLLHILRAYIPNKNILWLLQEIISSFHTHRPGIGLPLGNLTSQLFVNIYMNMFDQFVKHKLKAKYYIRYADDFVFFSEDRQWLNDLISKISSYLSEELKLRLHPRKVSIETIASGVDFLGWVHFPHHRVLRTTTKRRALEALEKSENVHALQSYHGLLSHGDAYGLQQQIADKIAWLELDS